MYGSSSRTVSSSLSRKLIELPSQLTSLIIPLVTTAPGPRLVHFPDGLKVTLSGPDWPLQLPAVHVG